MKRSFKALMFALTATIIISSAALAQDYKPDNKQDKKPAAQVSRL